jgi:phage terminase large subunit
LKINLNPKYKLLFTDSRYFVVTGGRGSGKSYAMTTFLLLLTYENNHRILFTRYTLTSAHISIIPEFISKIEVLGLQSDFYITKDEITNIKTGSQIIFRGIKTSSGNQTANLKSIAGVTTWVLDEAEELRDEKVFDDIDRSIRVVGTQNRVILILNPCTKEHFIYERFFVENGVKEGSNTTKEGTTYIHTTYLDNLENLSESFLKSIEQLKEKNIEKFNQSILGGWQNKAEGVIYENWTIKDFDNSLPYIYGLDFGSNDPDALTKVAINHSTNEIFIKEEYFKNNTSFEALTKILENRCGYNSLIIADAAERRMITDLYDLGFNIEKCKKGDKSVQRGIKLIQSYTLCIDPNSINLQKALNNYVWHDSKSGVPNHNWSDLCDSFRYAVVDILNETNSQIQW